MRLPLLEPGGETASSWDWSMLTGPEVEGLEASGSTVGVTGVTDMTIGVGGSGATGDRVTMLIGARETRDGPNVGGGASMRSTGKKGNTRTMFWIRNIGLDGTC